MRQVAHADARQRQPLSIATMRRARQRRRIPSIAMAASSSSPSTNAPDAIVSASAVWGSGKRRVRSKMRA
jgi:hypothetical protein